MGKIGNPGVIGWIGTNLYSYDKNINSELSVIQAQCFSYLVVVVLKFVSNLISEQLAIIVEINKMFISISIIIQKCLKEKSKNTNHYLYFNLCYWEVDILKKKQC